MADKINMSLEDIISKNKKFSRGRGGNRGGRGGTGNRGGRGVSRGASSGRMQKRGGMGGGRGRGMSRGTGGGRGRSISTARPANRGNQNMYYGGGMANGNAGGGGKGKLNIANLFYGVSDSDIKELFREFGKIQSSAVHYDQSGKSLGTAHVLFEKRADALRAMNHYNNIDLDNRPMRISMDGEARKPVMKSPAIIPAARRVGRGRGLKRLSDVAPKKLMGMKIPPGGGRGRQRGAGRGFRRGGNRGGGPKKTPTAAELDAELDAYSSQASK